MAQELKVIQDFYDFTLWLKVLASLLSRPAGLPGGRIYGVEPGGSGILRGERPARLFVST